ncbi:hypothetical protein FGRMN_10045 [Fusarium graminum]|nr:hypothetical protein FGRMN_10045 [Fusarium graminum]
MHFLRSLLLLGATRSVLGAISLGEFFDDNVAWQSGDNPCWGDGYGVINEIGDNPCDAGEFKVKDSWYKLEGCGGDGFKIVRTHPGGWEAKCDSNSWQCAGIFTQSWQCG